MPVGMLGAQEFRFHVFALLFKQRQPSIVSRLKKSLTISIKHLIVYEHKTRIREMRD